MRFLVDEDLPRSLATALRSAGHEVFDVRDIGLRGRPDHEVFTNILSHPPGSHAGILVAHFPNEMPITVLNEQVLSAVKSLEEGEITGNLVMIEPGRLRIRRPGAI
jgi:hypothetical protein